MTSVHNSVAFVCMGLISREMCKVFLRIRSIFIFEDKTNFKSVSHNLLRCSALLLNVTAKDVLQTLVHKVSVDVLHRLKHFLLV